jgi:hypothetical protein
MGVAPTAHAPRPRESPLSFTTPAAPIPPNPRTPVGAVARRQPAPGHRGEDRVVNDLTRARTELDAADPFVLRETSRDHEVAEDVRAAGGKFERRRHLQNEVGLAQPPAIGRELGQRRHLRRVPARHSGLDPGADGRNLRIAQPALADKLAVAGSGMPRGHVLLPGDARDEPPALGDVLVGDQRERRGLVGPMARNAVRLDDRGNRLRERDGWS